MSPYLLNNREPQSFDSLEISFHCTAEADELWPYMGRKSHQCWAWHAIDKNLGILLAWANSKRTDESLLKLLALLEDIPIGQYYTDDWGAYAYHISSSMHTVGKDKTWKTERKT